MPISRQDGKQTSVRVLLVVLALLAILLYATLQADCPPGAPFCDILIVELV